MSDPTNGEKKRAGSTLTLADRLSASLYSHSVCAGMLSALLVFGVLAVTFWFVIFSGLSASADFVYSQF